MRTVTLRVPDDWRGLVDSWAVQVMLKDFSRNHVLSELVVDPQPGRARLSLSLPDFRTEGVPESIFLRRLIASYLPALKSFTSSKRAVPLPRLHGRAHEIGTRVAQQKALPATGDVWTESSSRELDYTSGAYGMQQSSGGLKEAGSSDAAQSLSSLRKTSLIVFIVILVAAILFAAFFFRRSGRAPNVAGGTPMPGYHPWNPKVL